MIPLSDYFGKVIDCRKVVFDCRFFHFSNNTRIQLIDSFYSFVNSLFGEECVMHWTLSDRAVCNQNDLILKLQNYTDQDIFMDMIGDVKCNRIYNKTTLNQYDRDLQYRLPFFTTLSTKYSIDYPEYSEENLKPYANLNSIEELKNAIKRVFDLEDRINKNVYSDHAIQGGCFTAKNLEQDDSFFGVISLWISYFSIQDDIKHLTGLLYQYGTKIATEFTDINVIIKMNQSCLDFLDSRLFFKSLNANNDGSPTTREQRMLADYMYLQDIGWANIISPYTARLLEIPKQEQTEFISMEQDHTCIIRELGNGEVSIQNKRDIAETTIQDMKSIKSIVYHALYPGTGRFPITWPYWRSNWENTPIFSGELITENNQIVFQHKETVNPLFLSGTLNTRGRLETT